MSCSSVLTGGDKGNLSVVGTVFDKLNQVYKEYLDAEQAYTAVGYRLFYYAIFSVYESGIYRNSFNYIFGLFSSLLRLWNQGPVAPALLIKGQSGLRRW